MKKARLLSTVAAAIAARPAARRRRKNGRKDEAPARAPAAQQKAPAEKMAPPMHAGENKPTHKAAGNHRPGAAKNWTPGHGQNIDTSVPSMKGHPTRQWQRRC